MTVRQKAAAAAFFKNSHSRQKSRNLIINAGIFVVTNWMNIALIACLIGGLAIVCWSWWFNAKESARDLSDAQRRMSTVQSLMTEFRASFNQEQMEMTAHMEKLRRAGHYPEATMLLDRLLPAISDHNSALYVHLLALKVDCLLRQGQIEQPEKICADYVQENVSNERRLMMLDGFASYILYQSSAAHFARAEKFARRGLEIARGTRAKLTLKGTLGSLLVEQGNYAEGEKLLTECLQRSQALQDQAISSFYLGMIKVRSGDAKEGKRLIKWALKMYPESWMVEKGKALLKEVRT
jgi:tetratricopeptide (TPR) repeat protein